MKNNRNYNQDTQGTPRNREYNDYAYINTKPHVNQIDRPIEKEDDLQDGEDYTIHFFRLNPVHILINILLLLVEASIVFHIFPQLGLGHKTLLIAFLLQGLVGIVMLFFPVNETHYIPAILGYLSFGLFTVWFVERSLAALIPIPHNPNVVFLETIKWLSNILT